ncbi:hypothetical protein [Spirosoma luteum]|uniref:hypothetical protein n=1 Tax=Spirosoma luteum TaxID=431553 RepID=UPI00036A5120|nr:hypothetical protein [Spirosoma luteum]
MNTASNKNYDPANDDNQGVVQLMAQAEVATPGVSQVERMNPVTAQGPEPIKEEVNDEERDGVNDDVLAEGAVEESEADEKNVQ